IERSQVGERAAPLVLVLDERGPSGPGRDRSVDARPRLDRGLLVGAEHVLVRAERLALKDPLVEIEHDAGLLGEARVAREDPAAVTPGSDRVFIEPAPDRRARDRLDDAALNHEPAQILARETRERQTKLARERAGKRLDLSDDPRGEKPACVPAPAPPPSRRGALRRSAC